MATRRSCAPAPAATATLRSVSATAGDGWFKAKAPQNPAPRKAGNERRAGGCRSASRRGTSALEVVGFFVEGGDERIDAAGAQDLGEVRPLHRELADRPGLV